MISNMIAGDANAKITLGQVCLVVIYLESLGSTMDLYLII